MYWVMLVVGGVLLVAINGALVAVLLRFRAARGRQPRRLVVRRPAQLGTAGVFAALAAVTFVIGVIETDNAKKVEASGSNGLQAAAVTTAQRSLSLPPVSP